MKRLPLRKIAALLLAAALAAGSAAGCGAGSGGGAEGTESGAEGTENGAEGQKVGADGTENGRDAADGGEQAMGRFMEEEAALPCEMGEIYDIRKLDDGTVRLIGSDGNGAKSAWDSADGGASWEKAYDFPEELFGKDQGYVGYAALSADGRAACAFNDTADGKLHAVFYLLDAGGKAGRIPFELPGGSENMALGICFLGNGQLCVKDAEGAVYQVDVSDGSVKQKHEFDSSQESLACYAAGEKLLIQTGSEVLVYDAGSGEQLGKEEALQKAMSESGRFYAVDSIDGGESAYFLSKGGLYHYAFGGSVAEQLADGSLNSLGSPSCYPISLVMLGEREFLVAANDSSFGTATGVVLLRYTYSADTPAKPDKELRVYSLYESKEMRQAITHFQKDRADVYVNYETALSEENGVTLSDALKTLTTEIMAGKGPDVLILDGMPVQSYIEKGILEDLSGLIPEGDYFDRILSAYQGEDGKICAAPARFSIPMAQAASGTYAEGESFLEFTAQAGVLSGLDPRETVEKFWYGSGASWKKEDGTLDEAKVREFLENLKNAYGEYEGGGEESGNEAEEEEAGDRALRISRGGYSLASGKAKANAGLFYGDGDYDFLLAVNQMIGDGQLGLIPGQAERVFVPLMVLGISSQSAQKEIAGQFVSYMFSKEAQGFSQGGGLPVEKEAFRDSNDGHEYGGLEELVMVSGVDEDARVSYAMRPRTEEEMKWLTDLAESLETPALCDGVIQDVVAEEGEKALKGECSVDEAVNAILQKTSLYLAE